MSLHNLATVFGPTLLRPSEKESKLPANPNQPISMTDSWSLEVMSQVGGDKLQMWPLPAPPWVLPVVPTQVIQGWWTCPGACGWGEQEALPSAPYWVSQGLRHLVVLQEHPELLL